MAKYQVEVGGFVSTYRQRTFIVYGDDETEAEQKAIEKFISAQQVKAGNMCDEGIVNNIRLFLNM